MRHLPDTGFHALLNGLFLLEGDCIFVSALHSALLVQILVWQTAMSIDVAEAVLRPNHRANGTRFLFIKPHVQHLVVVSISSTLAHLLMWLGVVSYRKLVSSYN
jgi:hypothetical protein